MTITQLLLFIAFGICCTISNVFWYRAKFFLEKRGFPISFFTNHWQDLGHLSQVAESAADPVERASAQQLRSGILRFLIVSLVFFAAFFLSTFRGVSL